MSIEAEVLQRLTGRDIEPIPDSDQEYADTHKVYVFNIWKNSHRIDAVPGLGAVVIPACEPGQRYSQPFIVPGKVFEHFDMGEGRLMHRGFPARSYKASNGRVTPGVVDDILKSYAPRGQFSPNLVQWGVFAASGAKPTEAELKAAESELRKTAADFVRLADALWLEGDQGRRQINATHRELCLFLGVRKPWLEEVAKQDRDECPACGEEIKAGIARCPHCTAILDPVKWAQFSGETAPEGKARK